MEMAPKQESFPNAEGAGNGTTVVYFTAIRSLARLDESFGKRVKRRLQGRLWVAALPGASGTAMLGLILEVGEGRCKSSMTRAMTHVGTMKSAAAPPLGRSPAHLNLTSPHPQPPRKSPTLGLRNGSAALLTSLKLLTCPRRLRRCIAVLLKWSASLPCR